MIVSIHIHFDGLVHEKHNSIAPALELHLSCTNQSIFRLTCCPCPILWGWHSMLQQFLNMYLFNVHYSVFPYRLLWKVKCNSKYTFIISKVFTRHLTDCLLGEVWGVFCELRSDRYPTLIIETLYIDGFMQERCNSIANSLELRLLPIRLRCRCLLWVNIWSVSDTYYWHIMYWWVSARKM